MAGTGAVGGKRERGNGKNSVLMHEILKKKKRLPVGL